MRTVRGLVKLSQIFHAPKLQPRARNVSSSHTFREIRILDLPFHMFNWKASIYFCALKVLQRCISVGSAPFCRLLSYFLFTHCRLSMLRKSFAWFRFFEILCIAVSDENEAGSYPDSDIDHVASSSFCYCPSVLNLLVSNGTAHIDLIRHSVHDQLHQLWQILSYREAWIHNRYFCWEVGSWLIYTSGVSMPVPAVINP